MDGEYASRLHNQISTPSPSRPPRISPAVIRTPQNIPPIETDLDSSIDVAGLSSPEFILENSPVAQQPSHSRQSSKSHIHREHIL